MLASTDKKVRYSVMIPYKVGTFNSVNLWSDHCARAIELFGLPGDKYNCSIMTSGIKFEFIDSKDAMLFELCCG